MNDLIIMGHAPTLQPEALHKIMEFEAMAKDIKAKEDALKAGILAEMEKYGIYKIDMPELCTSYVGETERETFDSKALKAEFPDIYAEYTKTSKVKPSIRITLRKAKAEEA